MGLLDNLSVMLGSRVTQVVNSQLFDWIRAVSEQLDGIQAEAQVRYVDKAGNDATGDGTRGKPFLTIQAAINSITDASSTKPYDVKVGPGIFTGAFTLKNGVYVVGSGSGAGKYDNVTVPGLTGITVLAPTAANILAASMGGAGIKSCGLLNCSVSTTIVADFNAVGSLAASSILLQDITTLSDITIRGTVNLESAILRNIVLDAANSLTIDNMGKTSLFGVGSDGGLGLIANAGSINFTQSAAIQGVHFVTGCTFQCWFLTWTSALLANFMAVLVQDAPHIVEPNNLTLTGAGVQLLGRFTKTYALADAASQISFGDDATAGAVIGVAGGINILQMTPTANRVLTIDRSSQNVFFQSNTPTEIYVHNNAVATAVIDIALGGGASNGLRPTYVPPGSIMHLIWLTAQQRWHVEPLVQSGTTTLTNGVSPAILADIAANSRVVSELVTKAAGNVGVHRTVAKTNGTRAGGGQFVLTSVDVAGATVATDQSTYEWHVYNNGG